ncbi:MAG: type VI secretion system tip protein VgrG, partial [Hydrogenophilales bacterium]|nr:type VI secretion system tip protein VgrG [Hydrogenophilales bacterium]
AFTLGRFQLADHPEIDQHDAIDREFILTKISLNARNNLPEGLGSGEQEAVSGKTRASANSPLPASRSPFTSSFTATRNVVPIIPKEIPAPIAPQLMSAIVVGPAGEEIYTDNLGRIKVNLQFPRPADHAEGGASFNDKDSVWLRVVQQWSGSEYGALYIPRVGDEVTLQFINGDIDRPIVTGTLYNGTHHPAAFTHTGDLPGNKAMSGIKSKMYKGAGANELVLDDTTNEQRIRIATDHGKTELSQGYLVHPRVEGKGTPGGEGFELRTDLSGALRAALGILISTDARHKATGKQLDRQEFQGQIELALSILKNLSELSTTHHAEDTDHEPQEQLLEHVKNWEASSNTDKDGDKSKGGQPIVAISGQAGIALSTPQNATLATGTNLDMVSVQDTSISTGRSFKARAAEIISLFSHKLGMKLIAASGKIDIQAHSDNVEIIAANKVILTGLEGIELKAPKITYIAQGAGTEWGNNQIVSKILGNHIVHAADHKLAGPAALGLNLPNMPQSEMKTDEKFVLNLPNMEPLANWKYRAKLAGGQIIEGASDADGRTEIAQSDMINALNLELLGPADTPPAAPSGEQA